MNRIELGAYLREQRHKLGKTLKEMAADSDVSFPYLSDLEIGGVAQPRYSKLQTIAEHYKVDLNLLLEIFYPKNSSGKEKELDEKLAKAFADPGFLAGMREKVSKEKMGTYTKMAFIQLYESYVSQKTRKRKP